MHLTLLLILMTASWLPIYARPQNKADVVKKNGGFPSSFLIRSINDRLLPKTTLPDK